ncbi:MAG: permease [Planctomycetaceae bacterium]|nr:permease [Planctomycetaceae bacterium]
MKRITRYVLLELLSVFLVTLTGITLLLILAGVASEGMREGLGFGPLMRMVPYVVPVALQVSVPATILLATSSVFGRMSADNEIVAIKSLGISPLAVLRPAFLLAFVISLVAVWINDIAVSWGRTGIYRVIVESVEEVTYRMLKTQREYQTRAFSINVKDVVDEQLIQPTIRINTRGGRKLRFDASTAELRADAEENKLKFILTDLNLVEDDISAWFDHYELEIPLLDATRKGDNSSSPSLVPLRRISTETRKQQRIAGQAERRGATMAAFQMMTGDFSQLADYAKWKKRFGVIDGSRSRLNRLHLEPWRRWATGFSCFFFVLVGAPLAIYMKTANFFTTFAACFLPILIVYYPLLAMGVNQCKDGAVPPYTVWLGNVVLSAIGAWLIRRVVRY